MQTFPQKSNLSTEELNSGLHYRTDEGFVAYVEDKRELFVTVENWCEDLLPSALQQSVIDTEEKISDILQKELSSRWTPEPSEALSAIWGPDCALLWTDLVSAEVTEKRIKLLRNLQHAKYFLENAVAQLTEAYHRAPELGS